jgi:hypothetical protein
MRRPVADDVIAVLEEIRDRFQSSGPDSDAQELRKQAIRAVAEIEVEAQRFKNQVSAENSIHDACVRRFNAALLPVFGEAAAIAALSNEAPFVAMIDLASLTSQGPMFQWHFVVPLAVVQNEVIFHDPGDGPDRRAKLDDFLAAWATAGYRGVHLWTP